MSIINLADFVDKLPAVLNRVVFSYFSDAYVDCVNDKLFDEYELILYDSDLMAPNIYKFNHSTIFNTAARAGKIENLEWLLKHADDHDLHYGTAVFAAAAVSNSIETLEWLWERKFPHNIQTFYCAVQHSNEHVLNWLLEHKFQYSRFLFGYVNKNTPVSTMNWISKNTRYQNTDNIFEITIEKGNIPVLDWLLEHKFPHDNNMAEHAASSGKLESLKWLLKHNFLLTVKTFNNAVIYGDTAILDWLLEHKCPYDESAFNKAVDSENINILDWLLEHEFPYDTTIIWNKVTLINKKHIVVKWLIKNRIGCPDEYYAMYLSGY